MIEYNKKIYAFTVGDYSYYTEQGYFAFRCYKKPLGHDIFIEIDDQKYDDAVSKFGALKNKDNISVGH